jgi:A/G-specific adenine glycosylase
VEIGSPETWPQRRPAVAALRPQTSRRGLRLPFVEPSRALLAWYRIRRRDLPWRRTRDPWAIWVSEVMLQQTRVEHVVPYFERFLALYPTPAALAGAPLEQALAAWSGLGYYRRLRLLHRAAGLVRDSGGVVPGEAAALRRLPGIGDYTAAAIASIAYGRPTPVLDGNVERVLCRWLGVVDAPRTAAVRRRLLAAAADLLVEGFAGDGNQALMELGALVCTPRSPSCGGCPLGPGCHARAAGEPEAFPRPLQRPASRRVALVTVVVESAGRVLLFRRDDGEEVLGGTWELPWSLAGEDAEVCERLRERYGIAIAVGATLGAVKHSITVRRLEVVVRRGALEAGEVAEGVGGREVRWASGEDLRGLPLSSLVSKVLALATRGPESAGVQPGAVSPAGRRRPRG